MAATTRTIVAAVFVALAVIVVVAVAVMMTAVVTVTVAAVVAAGCLKGIGGVGHRARHRAGGRDVHSSRCRHRFGGSLAAIVVVVAMVLVGVVALVMVLVGVAALATVVVAVVMVILVVAIYSTPSKWRNGRFHPDCRLAHPYYHHRHLCHARQRSMSAQHRR